MRRLIVIGIVGGIGSGKSAVTAIFRKFGARCVDADAIAHRLINRKPVQKQLVRWWGKEVVRKGRTDRAGVARRVFGSPANLKRLNSLLHPLIGREIEDQIRKVRHGLVVLEAPLLLEVGGERWCDEVVFVDAPKTVRLKRVLKRGWTPVEFRQREGAQWPLARKKAKARFRIDNSGPLKKTMRQIRSIVTALESHQQEI